MRLGKKRQSGRNLVPSMANKDYEKAYSDTVESLISDLWTVETPDSVTGFTVQAANHVRSQATNMPEFYIGEFLNIFKDAVVDRCRVEIAACERAISDAKADADAGTVELQARLTAAMAAQDREAEHAVWRERDTRQAACQGKIDASTRRIEFMSLRMDACQGLASALGASFE